MEIFSLLILSLKHTKYALYLKGTQKCLTLLMVIYQDMIEEIMKNIA